MSGTQCVDQKSSGSDSSSTGEEERLRQLFLSCDSNHDGCLDCNDIYDMCRKLNMVDCAEEIINTLGANTKGSITFDEFLSCREKVFQMQTEADNVYISKASLGHRQRYKQSGFNFPTYTSGESYVNVHRSEHERNENSVCKINENINLGSSASETSLVNSGAEYDSGAQDLCGEPQSLHLLMQRDFTDLYKIVFPLQELTDTINIQPVDKLGNLSKHKEIESYGTKSSIEIESTPYLDNVRHLFECANTLHIQRTAQLRSEIRDLSHRLQGLQTSRDMNYREVQRLQREKEQLRNELTNQVSRYEDRLTELHSVIAELRRRLEHTESNIIHEVEEFEENDIDNDETNDNVSNNYKSDKKLITSKLSLLNTFNNIHSTNQYELNKDISENSDTSVDVILDGDDDDDDENDNVEDVVASPNDDTRDKYVGIVKQRHQLQLASHNFLMQTNLIYDQLNHNHNLTFLRNHNNNDDNNNNKIQKDYFKVITMM
ncbi:Colorectal mutant cancer protein [Schistosoma japonicum]|nr:Colorectal mutant cancer protein [Schistosoma japonicum]